MVAALALLSPHMFAGAADPESGTIRVAVPGGEIVMTVGPHAPVPRAALIAWIENSARAITEIFGRFGVPEARLDIRTGGRGRIHGGRTDDLVAHVSLSLGRDTTPEDLAVDWVLTHEFVHLATPTLPRRAMWFMEGVATYVEPLARARTCLLGADAFWAGIVEGLPNGGGDVRAGWTLEQALDAADKGVGEGLNVLTHLHAAWGKTAVPVDLPALFKRLGVSRAGGRVIYDDAAPLARIRQELTRLAPTAPEPKPAPKAAAPPGTGPRTSRGGG